MPHVAARMASRDRDAGCYQRHRPEIMGRVLGVVYRVIATDLIKKAGHGHATTRTGAVTLIQRFGGALNLNIHFHMLFLDGVYVDHPNGTAWFRWVKAPTNQELTQLAHTIAHRVGRFLERQSLLERDAENSYLASDAVDADLMNPLLGHSIIYRIAVGLQAGRKVFSLQTLPACDRQDPFGDTVGKVAGISLHAGVSGQGPGTPEAGTAVSLYLKAGGVRKAPVADAEWQHPLPAEDAVPGWNHACDL